MNKKSLFAMVFLLAATVMGVANASAAEKTSTEQSKPLPRVLLIGDSIRGGYQKGVQKLLEGKALVIAGEGNGQDTWNGLEKLDAWLGDGQWDVIHFNWGLWDVAYRNPQSKNFGHLDKVDGKLTTSLPDYEKNLRALVARLKKTGATLVWASTTPVPDGEPGRIKGDEVKYNAVAAKIMAENGIAIDDLHAEVIRQGRPKTNNVHDTGDLSKKVADNIVAALTSRGTAATPDKESPAEKKSVKELQDDQTPKPDTTNGFVWESAIPDGCPFPRSPTLTGIFFTGRNRAYRGGDTWYPCWAIDGNLYSPWTDGAVDGVVSGSSLGDKAQTGHGVMIGDDPLQLEIHNTSPPKVASALPYRGRYPAGSLVYNGIWYYGTYCLGPEGAYKHNGVVWNWPNLGPMPGYQISRDYGRTWEPSLLTPDQPLFPEPAKYLGPVKMGAPHFVDFGRNMEHSPDGKAYLLGMGAEENDPQPRPCLKPGAPGQPFELNPGCTDDFAHANLSWISADQVYLARVKPSPETINDIKAYEFFAGHDADGKPVWTADFAKIKPLLEWNNHMGCVTATYVPGLGKYLMCITNGWPTMAKMTSYILEADVLTGPWRMVAYMKDFGEQGFFLNFPSKFISADGRTLWLCYSANFSHGLNGVVLKLNPPGGRGVLRLHQVKLLGPKETATALGATNASAAGEVKRNPKQQSPGTQKSVKELQEEFLKLKFGMFIHYNMATYKGVQWVAGYHSPADFNPGGKIDTDAWADAAVSAGMKYAVLTAKHVAGFCLWDSKYTTYDVMNPDCPYKQDLVAQFIQSFKSRGLKVGLYYCWRHPGFGDPNKYKVLPPECDPATHTLKEQNEFQKAQIAELIEKYPDVFYLWNDSLDPQVMPAEEALAFIRSLRPDLLSSSNWWNWGKKGTPYADIAVKEMRHFPEGNTAPGETCWCLEQKWFWEEGARPKTAKQVVDLLNTVNGRNSNLLLNVGPNKQGKFEESSVKVLAEIGKLQDPNATADHPK